MDYSSGEKRGVAVHFFQGSPPPVSRFVSPNGKDSCTDEQGVPDKTILSKGRSKR